MAELKQVINQNILNKDPFWGAYSELNKARTPTNPEIQRYQLQKLEEFQKAAQKESIAAKNINTLFLDNSINSMPALADGEQDLELADAVNRIVTNISEFRDLTKWNLQKDNALRYQQAQAKLKELSAYLTFLKQRVAIDSPVYNADLERLNALIAENSLRSFGQAAMVSWIKNLSQIQGELVEELGTAWLAKRIPSDINVLPLSTGKMYYKGGQHGSAGQLIQDIITIDVQKLDILHDVQVQYKIGSQPYTSTLSEFLNMAQTYSGSESINISDDLYGTLLDMSALNIQAKSGKNQLPWNTLSKNTNISIGEFDAVDGLELSVLRTFELLHTLDQEKPKDQWVTDNRLEYNALANYGLATVLSKILHLSERGNQYLLTPSGFITYPERLSQLFKTNSSVVKVRGDVTINNSTLSKMYAVSISSGKQN